MLNARNLSKKWLRTTLNRECPKAEGTASPWVDFVTFILLSYFDAVYLWGLVVFIARQNYTVCLQAWSLSIISMPGTGQVRFKMQTVTCGLRIWIARGQVHENVGVYEQIHNLIGFSFSEVNDLSRIGLNSVRIGKYKQYRRLSLNGHLYKTDTSVKRTPRVGPCLSLLPLFDSL